MFIKVFPNLRVLFLVLFFLIPSNLYSETDIGCKFLKNYSYLEYDHHFQNWGMAQAKNGIIYVANQAGVLEFDGVSWRPIGIPIYAPVRSLTIDATGTVYIGGKGEIGYLAPDERGTLKYNSLLGCLPDDKKIFSDVWKTYTSKKGIYFQASEFLLRWDSKQMKVWEPVENFHFSFFCKETLFIRQKNVGLMQMDNDSLRLVPGGEIFAAKKIYMLVPYNSMDILIGTDNEGLYIYNGTSIIPFPTGVDDYLKRYKLYHGICLSTGDFALATLGGGLVIIDPHGRIKHIFNKSYGLQDEMIYYVFEDKQENLWLCLSNGISKIEYNSPISIYDERSSLSGMVLSVVRRHDKLYVGTINGLYYLESPFKFRLIPGISGSCWDLCSIDDLILTATSEGVFSLKKDITTVKFIKKDPSYVVLPSKYHPGRAWCGTRQGLVVLFQENGQWREEHRFEVINQEIRSIVEDKKRTVWLGTLTGNVFKVDFDHDIRHPVIARYDNSHGLPDGEIYAAWAAGHVVFATQKGIFRFDDEKKKFVPEGMLGAEFTGGPDSKHVFRLVEDKSKNIWFHSQSINYQAFPQPGESFKINSQPFRRIPPNIQVNNIYPDPDGKNIWFASLKGLIRYDTTIKKNYQQNFQTIIRRVLANETLIFDGFKNKISQTGKAFFTMIEYKDRNLYFEFAAPSFEAETETQYQCYLEGYDKDWSAWKKESKRNYTNLDSGLYTFRVRARNVYQHQGDEDVFRFEILLPWYKTWWAFLSYVSLSFLLTYLIFKWRRSVKLEKEKQRLEKIVKERTKEINEKNKQLEEQSEKLKEMDQVKSRFFANISHEFRTPLTLIISPLEQMLSQDRDKEQKKELNVMLRNSQRLLTLINQLLDLSRIDSGSMRLHAGYQNIVPFLKEILEAFRGLALQNRLNLEFVPGEEDISLYFDAPKIEEVMYNLLINAIKFTPAGGKITVSVSKQEGKPQDFVKMSVRDTGIGIPESQLDHIFDRFYQADTLKKGGHKGTGIGLALVKELIKLHHGEISVNSQEGKGTEFVILLYMGDKHLKFNEIVAFPGMSPDSKRRKEVEKFYILAEEAEKDSEEEDEDIYIETDEEHEKKTGEEEKNVILVVEDHTDVRKYIRKSLEPLYKVVEAGDGKKGIEKARKIIPDLIVSDIMMPEVDGYELCRELKKDIKTSHIPIILLTAKASEESALQGLETGANDYITKPFNTPILLHRIKNLMDLRRQLQLKIQREKMMLPSEIPVSSMDEIFFKEFQGIIEKNLSDEDFNIDILCKKLYMGRATLFRKIKALTGETPNQFILSYRLERAAQLFRENFGNVSEVSAEVGFSTTQYFAKCFKERFHQSPKSYRASHASKSGKQEPPGKKK